ncbi:hypothetical protein L202_01755 [Cryptococcus amylolentus CBS 6039]|uniref:RING-type E3 ubiquitin transferase n=1 Tax=Cryptococcus amylolentus CBS 6039 TaxID=1295533 RepID=A0A1E3I546_9TREE|nr:hypothetical protein L202_01755 [Cryptococcus amylolentus CBS 6039]ODN83658.1 hypothetical protein L202_01755 [Cryptococcus amylolentus CBS 6039]
MAKNKVNSKQATSTRRPSAGPLIPTPDPAHAIAHVPTHSTDEKRDLKSANGTGANTPEEVEDDICFICAEPIQFWSVGICGHQTCHVCAIRLRTFYKKDHCTFCKTDLPTVYFSRLPTAVFPEENHLTPSPAAKIAKAKAEAKKDEKWQKGLILPGTLDLGAFPYVDDKLGVVFEDEDMMEATLTLLRFNCPYTDCGFQAVNWASLERHTLSTHGLVICTLCRSQLSRFAHEQTLYPPHLLPLHDPSRVKRGQKPPKTRNAQEADLVKSWEAPHPVCEFCHRAYFGPDDLFKHMRIDHEECHVCREQGNRHVYFENYIRLEHHWRDDHYPCSQPQCLEDRFVVFGSELDLRAHMMEVHGNQMSARDRAQARTLQLDFSRPSGGESSGGRGFSLGGRNAGSSTGPSRMRNDGPQVQALDDTPAMTPAMIAQQRRQMAVDREGGTAGASSNQSARRRGFDGGLTRPAGQATNGPARSGAATPVTSATPREDVDDVTVSRHEELLSRVTMLTGDSPTKLASFRHAVRSFKTNESSSRDMIDTIFNGVFELDLDVTVAIGREIAKLFASEGDKDKEKSILEAVSGLRAEQANEFPSLSTGSSQTGYGNHYAGVASGTVLNVKRATRPSAGQGRAVWDRVQQAAERGAASRPAPRATTGVGGRWVPGATTSRASPGSEAFPSLGSSSAGPSASSSRQTWASGSAGPSTSKAPSALVPQIRSVNNPSNPSTGRKPKAPNLSAFPSLPSSSKPKKTTKEERLALIGKPQGRAAATEQPELGSREAMEGLSIGERSEAPQGGGKKGKGKGKQTLFTISARPQ